MAKAILLLSGGLDSTLAGALLKELGVEVEGLNFVSPFCQCSPKSLGCSAARLAAEQIGIEVRLEKCGREYLEIVKNPRFGWGSGVNPCIDCRIHVFSRAREYMEKQGADFVASGEVLGERPMSQRRKAMDIIEKESGLEDILLRPLSALLLPPTRPEREGLVDREKLKAIQGRRRLPQFALADELGVKDYLCPAGGCLLTESEYAARFRDLLQYDPGFGIDDARLLRYGRHFRLPSGTKVIVARDEEECKYLERTKFEDGVVLAPISETGPSALCRNVEDNGDIEIAAGIMAAYTKGGRRINVEIKSQQGDDGPETLTDVGPFDRAVSITWRIGSGKKPAAPARESAN
jgi:tRNA-specific 2-thiouridylase